MEGEDADTFARNRRFASTSRSIAPLNKEKEKNRGERREKRKKKEKKREKEVKYYCEG